MATRDAKDEGTKLAGEDVEEEDPSEESEEAPHARVSIALHQANGAKRGDAPRRKAALVRVVSRGDNIVRCDNCHLRAVHEPCVLPTCRSHIGCPDDGRDARSLRTSLLFSNARNFAFFYSRILLAHSARR